MKYLTVSFMALLILLLAVGCSDNSVNNDATETNLEDEFGGYTAVSESTAFGDADLLDEEEGTVDFDDPILSASDMDSLVNDSEAGYYHLRAIWGQLCYDSTVTSLTDWTGSLTISRGGIVVRRLIRFEETQDYILERTDRNLVEWASQTTVHNDGISFDIFIPELLPIFDTTYSYIFDTFGDSSEVAIVDTTYPDDLPVTVAFETAPYSRVFTLDEFESLDTIVYLDDSNAVAFNAFKLDKKICPRGFASGRWGQDEQGNNQFKGVWYSHRSRVMGFVEGHYGINDDGAEVFFGKWISRNGEFEGFIKGTYQGHPDENANENAFHHAGGWLRGQIYSENGQPIGLLKGKYTSTQGMRSNFFQLRWKLYCEDLTDDSDEF
ncbi:MAG: hypothetical protein DRP35_01305 [Candidatus Zixiibacteriota bacterium]|nr:MAG: hypothetical protein DRP35_01305 [candidate division Zixibacteria bacterium]